MHYQFMAPWVPSFVSCVEANPAPFVSFQLATVDDQGWPHVRTVVYRGFLFNDKTTNVVCCTTDKRMGKYHQICHHDRVEAAFWFPNTNRQFRIRGRARVIDDHHHPQLHMPQPSTPIRSGDGDDDSDDDSLELAVPASSTTTTTTTSSGSAPPSPLSASIVSPSQLKPLRTNHNHDDSYTTLASLDLHPPSAQDWHDEVRRHWDQLSKPLRQSFRRPPPETDITDESLELIDSIKRGVDGKKDSAGLVNFAVIAVFAEHVDVLDLSSDKRWVYEVDDQGHWSEAEVCP